MSQALSNSSNSETKNPLRISLSNFDCKKKNHLQVLIKKLGGAYDENLEYGTNILIAANPLSNKYKSATLLKIPTVTKKWLYKSLENGSFLPLENYFLPIFNELKIGVLGFSSNELADIKQKIEEKCGVIITDINEITKTKEDLLLIFLKTSEIKTYESFLHTLNKPVVHESWFRNCLEKNVFIRPEHFLLGHKGITQKISNQKELFHEEIRILSENKLKKCLKEIDCSDISYRFLSDCVIYFFNIEETYEKILKDVVNLTGAFYLNHYNISITHIVSQHYQEEDLSNFRKIGDNFFVVHPLWLKDCFFYKKKVSEFEYHLMPGVNLHAFSAENQSFIINSRNNNNALLRRTISNDETFSFREKKIHKPIKFSQENQFAKNISQENLDKNKKKMASPPFSKENPMVVKSFIFLNVNFFINTPDYKELLPYRMKILENSGRIVDNLKNSKLQIYYVLSDGIASLKIKAQNLENVNYVSFRWVDYCIEKKQVVKNHLELRLIHLSPLTFKMPLPCFKKSHMYVCGFPTQEKIILKSLMTVMGINILFDVTKISHLICEKNNSKKYNEVLEFKKIHPDNQIRIVKAQWIFKCLTEGKSSDEAGYYFEKV